MTGAHHPGDRWREATFRELTENSEAPRFVNRTPIRPAYTAPPPALEVSGLAVIGLTLSLLGVSIFGLIFSLIGLADIRHGLRTGRGIAIAGIVAGTVGMVGWLLLIVLARTEYVR